VRLHTGQSTAGKASARGVHKTLFRRHDRSYNPPIEIFRLVAGARLLVPMGL
jgi:hypothetical protein